ncbi:hypothetical protein K1W54_04865 [Micromonospora sp. CPCC 205371]|nr:hypothetical protein [Micromonospora sp. CPCC 205371]
MAPIVDMLAVNKALKGERVNLTEAEKRYAVREGVRRGMTLNSLALKLRMPQRRARILAEPTSHRFDVSDINAWTPLPEDCEVAA